MPCSWPASQVAGHREHSRCVSAEYVAAKAAFLPVLAGAGAALPVRPRPGPGPGGTGPSEVTSRRDQPAAPSAMTCATSLALAASSAANRSASSFSAISSSVRISASRSARAQSSTPMSA